MPAISDIVRYLRGYAPPELAEDWDNVGLLVGDESRDAPAVMTCLTLTTDVAAEAIERGSKLIVTHHPILFRGVKQITAVTAEGRVLLELIESGIAVYSPHTAYDSARDGINQQLAELFGLREIDVLRPKPLDSPERAGAITSGAGRHGVLSGRLMLQEFVTRAKEKLRIGHVQYVGDASTPVEQVAVACGSAAEFLPDAHRLGCDVLVTGEARFHACLQARELGMAMVLLGHYASERLGVERLAEVLSSQFPSTKVWASQSETDPLQWE